jgi:hypothetical protein
MAEDSEDRFKDDIPGVQRNADCKRSVETRGRMRMAGVRMGVFVSHGVL